MPDPAVAFSFIPAVAALVLIQINGVLAALGKSAADLAGDGQATYATLLVVGNGFVLTVGADERATKPLTNLSSPTALKVGASASSKPPPITSSARCATPAIAAPSGAARPSR